MSGRGDNNKNGSAGRGASDQSNQGFTKTGTSEKTSHGNQTGGERSKPKKKTTDQTSNRYSNIDRKEE